MGRRGLGGSERSWGKQFFDVGRGTEAGSDRAESVEEKRWESERAEMVGRRVQKK